MKILLVAPKSDFTLQFREAVEQEGNTVIYVNDRIDYGVPAFLRGSEVLWRITRRIPWWRARANRALQQEIIHRAQTFSGVELLLAGKGMNIKSDTLTWFRERGIPMAVWFGDDASKHPYKDWVQRVGPLWDHFFSFDAKILEQLPTTGHAKAHWLTVAVDPAAYELDTLSADDHRRYDADVCFIGAPYPERIALLEQLSHLNVKVFGWPAWKKTSLARFYGGVLNAKESAKAYRCATICLNANNRPFARGLNLKTFEICASKGFQLTDVPPDLHSFFELGTEVATFTDDTLNETVQYWLNHPEERIRIADAGYNRVVRDHTMRSRVREMLEVIKRPPAV